LAGFRSQALEVHRLDFFVISPFFAAIFLEQIAAMTAIELRLKQRNAPATTIS
jgi:hypothetical protein